MEVYRRFRGVQSLRHQGKRPDDAVWTIGDIKTRKQESIYNS